MKTILTILMTGLLCLPVKAEEIHVRMLVSTQRPYAGQPVRLTLEIEHPLRGTSPLRPRWPHPRGTLLVDEPPGQTARLGDDRAVELLYRVIRPVVPGEIKLDGGGVFAGSRFIPAPGRTLSVSPLPGKGRPANFQGLVGQIQTSVHTFTDGTLEIELQGDADLNLINQPALCADGTPPIPLSDSTQGHWPTWQRTLVLSPAPDCHPRLQLSWYDPRRLSYIVAAPPAGPGAASRAVLFIISLLLAAGLSLELWRIRRCRRLLNRHLAGLSHRQRLHWLDRTGVPGSLLARIDRHWRQMEGQGRTANPTPWSRPGQTLPWLVCRQLAVTIDKRRWHRP